MGTKEQIEKSTLLISTFSLWKNGKRTASNGIMDPMMYFFKPRAKSVFLLDQPYPGSNFVIPRLEIHKRKSRKLHSMWASTFLLYPFLKITNTPGTHLFFKLRDFFSTIEAGFRYKGKFDLFIGIESVNAMAGILLRKLGKTGVVVYYVSDYSPLRFNSKFLNNLYLWMDRFCAMNADYIWDVSLAMQPARIKAGLNKTKSAPVIHVPNALYKGQVNTLSLEKRIPHSIAFVGTLGLENGPDTAVSILSSIKEKYKDATLHIYGGGGKGFEEEYIQTLIKKLGLEESVVFHGFISDQIELSKEIRKYQISIAPYKKIKGSIRLYGDATKLRLYMASGLPVVSTDIPPLGKELAEIGAAVVVKDNKDEIVSAILDIFKNKKKYESMVQSAVTYARSNSWEKTYFNALKQMTKN